MIRNHVIMIINNIDNDLIKFICGSETIKDDNKIFTVEELKSYIYFQMIKKSE